MLVLPDLLRTHGRVGAACFGLGMFWTRHDGELREPPFSGRGPPFVTGLSRIARYFTQIAIAPSL